MIYAGIAMTANAILCYVLFVTVGPVGIAIATSVTGWINVVLLAFELRRRGEFILDDVFLRAARGIVLASLAMGALLWWLTHVLHPFFDPVNGLLVQIGALGALIAAGLLCYVVVATLTGALKPRTFLKDVLGR